MKCRVVLFSASVLTLLTSRIDAVDFRGHARELSVRISRTNPAFIALEELRHGVPDLESENARPLQPGKPLDLGALISTPATTQIASLRGLTIRSSGLDQAPEMLAAVSQAKANEPVSMAILSPEYEPMAIAGKQQVATSESKRQQMISFYAEQDWSTPSLRQALTEKVNEELARRGAQSPTEVVGLMATEPVANLSPAGIAKSEAPANLNYFTLSGTLHLKNGLAYTGGGEDISIVQVQDGSVRSRGRVRLNNGRFEIGVKDLQGYLQAELRSHDGMLLGAGELNLYRLPQIPYKQSKIENLSLEIRPAGDGHEAVVHSARSFGRHLIKVEGAVVSMDLPQFAVQRADDDVYVAPNVKFGSSFVTRAQADRHWASLELTTEKQRSDLRLFPREMIDALRGIALGRSASRESAANQAIIWGRVVSRGTGVAGATVELASEDQVRPIYFTSFIADPSLSRTTENGLFAFVGVAPGIQVVRAKINGRYTPVELVPTEAATVSSIEVDASFDVRSTRIQVVDQTRGGQEMSAAVNVLGSSDVAQVEAGADNRFDVLGDQGLTTLDVDGGPSYEMMRTTVSRRLKDIRVPMVTRAWLEGLLAQSRASTLPETGIAVGFEAPSDFEVHLVGPGVTEYTDILYFDSQGRVSRTRGAAGGGFVVFNIEPGVYTLSVTSPGSKGSIFSRTIVAEPQIVNYVHP